jgi:type I restriction enzyme R subunit
VKIPALIHLEKLGYKYLSLKTLDWNSENNIVSEILNRKVQELNPTKSLPEIEIYLKQVLASLSNDDLGKAFFKHLVNQNGIRIIDLENFENNELNCVTEFEYEKDHDSFRPDITLLVNGLPLAFIEVKKPNNPEGILAERKRIDVRLKNKNFKKIINLTQIMMFSNNMEYDDTEPSALQGAFYSSTATDKARFNFMREEIYKYEDSALYPQDPDIDFILKDTNSVAIKGTLEFSTNNVTTSPTNRVITSLFSKERFQFLLKYGITYVNGFYGIEKHIMRYPQMFATFAIRSQLARNSKSGIIWHTQGSGKTALSFYNVKYLIDYYQKRNKVAKLYFVVDRLQLLMQAKSEFLMRGLKVHTINSKAEFLEDFAKSEAISNVSGQLEITVINIQRFAEDAQELFDKSYNLNIQRIYFIDEAHRSYKPTGSFFANLRSSDKDAIMICLTGTPLLGTEPSTKLFGNYYHKYYYNQSIRDGYTLRLIREEIESSFSNELRSKIEEIQKIQKGEVPRSLVLSHRNFVKPLLRYVVEDLKNARITHNDESIGGMIICDSSEQAKEIASQFEADYPKLKSVLILHDVGTKGYRDEQSELFKQGDVDFLIVFNMLLTGFDAPRLKKLYFCRVIRDHNLLQALTRVNRPYGKFRYGYVVDFADITDEFDKTNAAYFAELTTEMGLDGLEYSNLFVSRSEIEAKIAQVRADLFLYDLTNAEQFSKQISEIKDKKKIRDIVNSLEMARDAYNLIRSLGYRDLSDKLDFHKLSLLYIEANNRLDLIRFKENSEVSEQTRVLINVVLENIHYTFKKIGEEELEIGNKWRNTFRQVQECLEKNFDTKDPEYVTLWEEILRIFKKRNIDESSSTDIQSDIVKLENILNKAKELNIKNQNLAYKYQGDYKFARIHKLIRRTQPSLSDLLLFDLLNKLRVSINELVNRNEEILRNLEYFEREVKLKIINLFDLNVEYEQFLDVDDLKIFIINEFMAEIEGLSVA